MGSPTLDTSTKLLHLSNVLHVPSICKMSVSQFARENNIDFKFHPFHCLIKDIQTQVILLQGHTHDRLYRFSPVNQNNNSFTPSMNNTSLSSSFIPDKVFELWHQLLSHPSIRIVQTVLKGCNVVTNKSSLVHNCIVFQKGKAHKFPFSNSILFLLN